MKKMFLYFAALTAVAVACRKVDIEPQEEIDPEPEVEMITETITGSRDVSTKVTIDNTSGAFAWTATNDQVAVHLNNGTYVSSAGASTSAKSATFDVTYPSGYTRDAFAVFPSSIVAANAENYGQTGHTLDVTLPSSYTLAQVSGETSPCPMIATNDPGSSEWSFKQLCGLLRLTINCIPPSTKRLEIDFDGKNIAGKFSIPATVKGDGSSEIALLTASGDNSSVITITKDGSDNPLGSGWLDGLVLNIPLPTGTYSNITVTAYDALTAGNVTLTMSRAFAYTASRQKATKKTASFPVFSVSTSTRVIFAPGNLQAKTTDSGASWSWDFAANPYDYVGVASANTAKKNDGTITVASGTVDIFMWSETSNHYGISNTANSGNSFVDWGSLAIGSYPANYWRTPTKSDWTYIIGKSYPNRGSADHRCSTVNGVEGARATKAIINTDNGSGGIKGLIIFPDYYDGPASNTSDITWGAGINSTGTSGWDTICTSTAAGWNTLNASGCVFLPLGGYYNPYSSPYWFGDRGYYWSTNHEVLRFDNSGYDPDDSDSKNRGDSVRLVHQIN